MRLFIIILSIIFYTQSSVQNVSVIRITDLEKRIASNSDTTYIVNFWATWCAPCVKELPTFDSINADYKNKKVKVLLISMDFKDDLESKLLPFIKKKVIKSDVMLLDETNGNYFIPKVSDQWSGAIPATLIVNHKNNIKHFFERKLNYEFLKKELEDIK